MTAGGTPAARTAPTPLAGLAGLAFFTVALAAAWRQGWPGPGILAASILAYIGGCAGAEGLPFAWRSFAQRPMRRESRRVAAVRIATKLVGLLALFGFAALAFRILPFLRESELARFVLGLDPVWTVGSLGLASGLYVAVCDRVMDDPDDSLHQVGRAVLLAPFREGDVLFALRCVVIKVLFLTIMWGAGLSNVERLLSLDPQSTPFLSAAFFFEVTRLLFLVDAAVAAAGYLATLRLFDWHVRATEVTAFGWVACLICYPPFFGPVGTQLLPYGDGPDWRAVIEENTAVFVAWSSAIVACHVVFVWSTVAFGARFSNLTHRGIIRHGPYRWMRHPAYVSKLAAWWILSLPGFYASGLADGCVRAAMLAGISGLYVLRATAEERMLSQDPAYRDYCAHIAANGLGARLAQRLQPSSPRNRTGL